MIRPTLFNRWLGLALLSFIVAPPAWHPSGQAQALRPRAEIVLIRELRSSNKPENLKKARAVLDGIRGTSDKPGWGMKDLDALKEQGMLLEMEKKHAEGFAQWAALTRNLARVAQRGGPFRDHYLECYYHMLYCALQVGEAKPSKVDRDKTIHQAAVQIVQLELALGGFGNAASRKRFMDLLSSDAALKKEYDAVKKK